jgi:hypothetical protein
MSAVNALAPCPGCQRHVRTGSFECPFCRGQLDGIAIPKPPIQFGAHRRSTLLFMGATIAALGASCSSEDDGSGTDAGPIDEGGLVDHYGAPGLGGFGGTGGTATGGTAGTAGGTAGAAGGPIDDSGTAGAGGGPIDEGGFVDAYGLPDSAAD